MKDITGTSFGLIIGYLLPGVCGFYSLSFWSNEVRDTFTKFGAAESSVGLFLLVILAALTVGLQVSIVRWLAFERILCAAWSLTNEDFVNLGSKDKLVAFRTAIDEQYRYHQFFGGMAVVQPFLWSGWIQHTQIQPGFTAPFQWLAILSAELLMIVAAIVAFRRYVFRSQAILRGDTYAQRVPQIEAKETGGQESTSQKGASQESTGEEEGEIDE